MNPGGRSRFDAGPADFPGPAPLSFGAAFDGPGLDLARLGVYTGMDNGDDIEMALGRALLWAISAALIFAGVAMTTGQHRPEPAHPCERWTARSPLLDPEGCYAAFEANPFPDAAEAE